MTEPQEACPAGCAEEHSFSGSCGLRWMGPAWEESGTMWVRDEEGRPVLAPAVEPAAE